MKTYCINCRKDTENLNSKIFKTKNDRLISSQNVLNAELKRQDL